MINLSKNWLCFESDGYFAYFFLIMHNWLKYYWIFFRIRFSDEIVGKVDSLLFFGIKQS